MSFLLTLDEEKMEEILPLLPKFEEKIEAAKSIFKIEGRKLEDVIKTLPHYQASYDQLYNEVKALEDWLLNIKEKKNSIHWKKYLERYSKVLGTRDIQAYIAGEKDMVELNQIIIEITLLKNNFSAIVEALKQLGWMASHMTKLRVAELQDVVL